MTSQGQSAPQSFPARLAALAMDAPDRPLIVTWSADSGEEVTTAGQLHADAVAQGRVLDESGVTARTLVAVSAWNDATFFASTHAAWMHGATVLPLDPRLPEPALDRVLHAASLHWADVVLLTRQGVRRLTGALPTPTQSHAEDDTVEPVPSPGFAFLSGGSSGDPKIIVNHGEHTAVPGNGPLPGIAGTIGMRAGQVQLVAGPLFHGAPASWSTLGLFHGHSLIVMERFDASAAVQLIERHGVQWVFLVPTMMARIAGLPDLDGARLASLEAVCHASAPCPPSVKDAWLRLIAPHRLIEGFGGTEAAGATVIRGDEWLRHRGSVGRPVPGWELCVLDENDRLVPTGEVGLIHFRAQDLPARAFQYVGATEQVTPDGWITLGDMGWLDDDGYLFVADRRSDLIISGGANIYPAEVEAILHAHDAVADVAVIGAPDPDLGRRVVAVVEVVEGRSLSREELTSYCGELLARYKVPREFIMVQRIPRNDQGKLRRTSLWDEVKALSIAGEQIFSRDTRR